MTNIVPTPPAKFVAQKLPTFNVFRQLRNLTATLKADVVGTKTRRVDTPEMVLKTAKDNSLISRNFMNFGAQTA